MAFDASGNLFLSDYSNNKVKKVTSDGTVTDFFGSGSAGYGNSSGTGAKVDEPMDIVIDSDGILWLADSANNEVRYIEADGDVSPNESPGTPATGDSTGNAGKTKFDAPRSLAVDAANNNLYVMDGNNYRIKKVDLGKKWSNQSYVTNFVGSGSSGYVDATGTSAKITYGGITVDSSGNLYMADRGNYVIRKITPAGVVTTFAGLAGVSTDVDGTGTAAGFKDPVDVAMDDEGNLYVTDAGSHKVKKITPAGVVTTYAGTGTAGSTDGSFETAQLNQPYGIAFYNGMLYVTSAATGSLKKVGAGNQFIVADDDSSTVSVSFTVTKGTLALTFPSGGGFSSGSNNQAAITISGTVEQLNDAMGTMVYTNDASQDGNDVLTYVASDGTTITANATVDIIVNATNSYPVLGAVGNQTTNEDTDKEVTLSATDDDGDTLTYSATVNTGNITASVSGTTLTLSPDDNWSGDAGVTVTVSDGNGGTDEETIVVTVDAVNDDPVLTAVGNQTTAEDTAKALTLNSSDTEGDSVTYTAVVNSGSLTAAVSGTGLNLTPAVNWTGTASITATVNDGNGGTDSETFDLVVTAVNDAPVLGAIGNQATAEDNAKVVALSALDDDGDSVTYAATVNSGSVAAAVSGASLTLTPAADWSGTANITVTVSDGNGGTDAESFDLVVAPVNDAPVLAAIGSRTTNEDTNLAIALSAADPEGDAVSYDVAVASGNVTAPLAGNVLTVTPAADWHGTAVLAITVSDGNGGTDSETINVTVSSVNDDPELTAIGAQSTDEDTTKTLTLAGTDVDEDTLTYSATVASGNVTATVTGTSLSLVPDDDWNGTANITITVSDGNGGTDSESVALTVNSVNDAPELDNIANQTTNEDTAKTITLSGTDPESDTLTYSASVSSGNVTASVAGTSLTLTPEDDWNGTASISVTVSDGTDTDSQTFSLNVSSVNDAPVLATVSNQTTNEDTAKTVTLSATDEEDDTLTYSATVNSGSVTATVSGAIVTLTPTDNWTGTANITVSVNDGNSGVDTDAFDLTVSSVNDDPELTAIGAQTTNEDTNKTLTLAATDIDEDSLTFSASSASINVTANVSGTTLTLIPKAYWTGSANITVTVSDGNGGTDNETFALTVNNVNDAPVLAEIGDQETDEDTSLEITLSTTDEEDDSITYTAILDSENVTATVTGNTVEFTPEDDWNGVVNATVTAKDGNGGQDSETFMVIVKSINDAPELDSIGSSTIKEDETKTITLSATDVENDTLTYTAKVNSGHVTRTLTGTTLKLVPENDWSGTSNITVTVDDGEGGTDTETFILTITAENDSPTLAAIGDLETPEDTTKTVELSATDPDEDTITYSVVVNAGNVVTTIIGSTLDLVPSANWADTANITVTAVTAREVRIPRPSTSPSPGSTTPRSSPRSGSKLRKKTRPWPSTLPRLTPMKTT